MKKWIILGVALCSLLVLAGTGFGMYRLRAGQHNPLPKSLQKQVNFVQYYPTAASSVNIDRETFKYDKDSGLLSFVGRDNEGRKLTFSEQSSPLTFVDIPEKFDKFITNMLQYKTFESDLGKVYLTRPKDLQNNQVAVMNARSTLLFIRADKDMSEDSWKALFKSLYQIIP